LRNGSGQKQGLEENESDKRGDSALNGTKDRCQTYVSPSSSMLKKRESRFSSGSNSRKRQKTSDSGERQSSNVGGGAKIILDIPIDEKYAYKSNDDDSEMGEEENEDSMGSNVISGANIDPEFL